MTSQTRKDKSDDAPEKDAPEDAMMDAASNDEAKADEPQDSVPEEAPPAEETASEEPKKERRGLFGRKKKAPKDEPAPPAPVEAQPEPSATAVEPEERIEGFWSRPSEGPDRLTADAATEDTPNIQLPSEPSAAPAEPKTVAEIPGAVEEGSPAAAATAAAGAPQQLSDEETKRLLRELKKQQKKKMEQDLAEAKELERKAKEMAKNIRQKGKLRAEFGKHTDYVRGMAPQLGFDPNRPITEIPPITRPDLVQVELITIQEGRSYVRILYDQAANRYMYSVIEPPLSTTEKEVLEFIRDTLVRTLDGRRAGDPEEWETYLTEAVERAIVDHSILVDEVAHHRLNYYIIRDFLGYGPIDVMMRDPMIEDISCDGPGIPLYIFHRQYESIKSNVVFPDEFALDAFVIRLAQKSGKHISIAEPLLDATLPDTSRLQASLSREVTTRGSSFTIRKFRADPLTPPDLIRLGTMRSDMCAFFWLTMEQGSSLIYAGGTASGKTTSLNAVCQFIPPDKKIVSIEDTREINLQHENWIAGLTRSGFGGELIGGKPAGAIDMYRLLAAALRQRPEYLLVGEVRGEEALTLFQAMATGHATYSTLHADSVMSAVYRLENPPINVPRIMLQTLDCVSVQIQARVNNRMVRRLKEIVEIVGVDPETGDLLTNTVFEWDPATDNYRYLGKSHIFDRIMEKNNLTAEQMHQEWLNRILVLDWMVEKGIRHITDVANVIAAYYANPEALLQRVRKAMKAKVPAEVEEA